MTLRLSFRGWLLTATVFVVICTLAFVAFLLHRSLRDHTIEQTRDALFIHGALLKEIVSDRWSAGRTPKESDDLADRLGSRVGMRVTLIAPDGVVIGDSELPLPEVTALENHKNRPEVRQAVQEGRGWSIRYSTTLGLDLMYAAQVLGEAGRPELVIRLALPLEDLARTMSDVRKLIFWSLLLGILLSLVMAFFVSNQVFRPVKELTRTALSISSGDLSQRLRRYPNHEIGDLGRAFDRMADHLQEEIEEVTRARDRLEAILRGMVEGVLVTDHTGSITQANRALRRLLDLQTYPIGRKTSEIVRNADLIEAFQRVARGEPHANLKIRTLGNPPRTLEIEMAALPGEGLRAGVVAVFHDITERQRIEEMRRDFVANVSHELRTPLAAIKGAVETLLSGALEDSKFSRRFTEVIERHVTRLEGIVLDLLELARLENTDTPQHGDVISVAALVDAAITAVADVAEVREVELTRHLPEEPLMVPGDYRQLEQALVNLLDNAVKYTNPKGAVNLTVTREGQLVRFDITDTGIGIPQDHQDRIFERFYRVDKNRSREVGGTGLGLAIVKHVAHSHGGHVTVASFPGRGSTFSLFIPIDE